VKPISIELHVEELALHGFEPGDRYGISEAVQRELSRLFTEQGSPSSLARGSQLARVEGPAFDAKPGSAAESIGYEVARAVYGGLSW
jgi:hypothetical protein